VGLGWGEEGCVTGKVKAGAVKVRGAAGGAPPQRSPGERGVPGSRCGGSWVKGRWRRRTRAGGAARRAKQVR